jgi:site-specific recombinase XerD
MTHNHADESSDSELVGDRVRIFQRGRMWYANFQHNGRQTRLSLKTTNKKEARRRAVRLDAELDAGRYQHKPQSTSIAQACADYMTHVRTEQLAKKTIDKYQSVLNRLTKLAEQRGVTSLGQLNLTLLDAYRAMRVAEGIHPQTLHDDCVIIRQLVNFALERDMLVVDPLKGIRVKKPKPTPQPCWNQDEVRNILAASPEAIQPALTLLAETGMRIGELVWLTWADIDLDVNVLHIRAKDGWQPKSGDQRSVPLSPVARQLLETLPRVGRWVMSMPASRQHPQRGQQWTERRLLGELKRVLKALALNGKLHTFRHFFISNALQRRTPLATLREWVGHVDEEIIKLYTHIFDDDSQVAMKRLGKANQRSNQIRKAGDSHQGPGSAQNQHNRKEE